MPRFIALALGSICLCFLFFEFSEHLSPKNNSVHIGSPVYETTEQENLFEGLSTLCAKTKWTNNVVFTCDKNAGGVGNVRNHMLNCVRYAIEGGGSLVLPRIIVRNPADIADIYGNKHVDMDYLFDRNHFQQSIATSCPQLKLYDSIGEQGISLSPESLDRVSKTGLKNPHKWRTSFDSWLYQHPSHIVQLDRSYLTYPIRHDSDTFSQNFGRILRFRQDVQKLAKSTLKKLDQPFLGVHLRTEMDALKVWGHWNYGSFEEQSSTYIQQAEQANLTVVYVASGDPDEVYRFSEKAPHLEIVTKDDLLSPKDRAHLASLTFDQQALVDYLVLLQANHFAGVAQSSFSWNIALKRHISSIDDFVSADKVLSDDLSTIYGDQHPKYRACMWP